ncbi:hypothetical protein [Patulibacter minatonensis]|uniref:hypothetical protein n=1 Tax=Patulibacter minatonensis TaxID=298163 RepID=UPI00047BC9BA|nr:hypothetical protein [Patulibacter minatonensis]
MNIERFRRGEWIITAGAVLLVGSLFLRWYGFDQVATVRSLGERGFGLILRGTPPSGWGVVGHPWLELLALALIAAVTALVLAARTGRGTPTYGAVVSLVVAVPVAVLALLGVLLRTLLSQPSLAADELGSNALIGTPVTPGGGPADTANTVVQLSPAIGSWVGLAAILLLVAGLWIAMADDRTDAAESAGVPSPVLDVPPLRPDPPAEPEPEPEPEPGPRAEAEVADASGTPGETGPADDAVGVADPAPEPPSRPAIGPPGTGTAPPEHGPPGAPTSG